MSTLVLSGWGQPHDALKSLLPQARHVPYADACSAEEALLRIAQEGADCQLAVGWSLGGQLLVRAIAEKRIAPKRLVLIAAPFRFVAGEGKAGMPADSFARFRANYAANPQRALAKGWELICMGDSRAEEVRLHMRAQNAKEVLAHDWLRWLDELESFDCSNLDFSAFPQTLLIQGAEDVVVSKAQAALWKRHIPGIRYIEMQNCGHAPHWHDSAFLHSLIGGSHV